MKGSLSQFQALFVSTTGTFTRGAMPAANFVDGLTALEGYPFDNAHEAGKAQVGYLAAHSAFMPTMFKSSKYRVSRSSHSRWARLKW